MIITVFVCLLFLFRQQNQICTFYCTVFVPLVAQAILVLYVLTDCRKWLCLCMCVCVCTCVCVWDKNEARDWKGFSEDEVDANWTIYIVVHSHTISSSKTFPIKRSRIRILVMIWHVLDLPIFMWHAEIWDKEIILRTHKTPRLWRTKKAFQLSTAYFAVFP